MLWTVAICVAGCCLLAQEQPLTEYGRKTAPDKGPRALGLVQLSGKKARIIPIAIMLDGKFYDAGSYKAAPVPMALDFGIVYEGFRTGVSQGTFTITQPGQLNHVWIAEGKWFPEGAIDPNKRKKYTAPVIADDDKDAPPVLHRRAGASDAEDKTQSSKEADKAKANDKDTDQAQKDQTKKDQSKDDKKDQQAASPSATPASTAPAAPTLSKPSETAKTPPAPDAAKPSTSSSETENDEPIGDPNRPRLRRGKPVHTAHQEPFTTFDAGEPLPGASLSGASAGKDDASAKGSPPPTVVVPAISDAGGPDPRPYTYDLKPEEEASYRSKMLDLAAAQLHPQAGAAKKPSSNSKNPRAAKSGAKAAKAPQPAFDDVKLRIFDLSSSNEPVLVLSARTHPVEPPAGANGANEEPKEITLIARSNLENELQKLFFSQTDSRHLDISPRMELIDAVDADGDGRGELLFRRTFDDGSAYAIYRVSRDGLWPLFEGTP
jgi:hypothetical protein